MTHRETEEPDSLVRLDLMPEDITYIILGLKDIIDTISHNETGIDDPDVRASMIADNERIIEYLEDKLTTYMHRKALYR